MVISVIIPSLNEEQTIADTLRLTVGLGFDEIIVVDGGSTDRTNVIVDSFVSDCPRSVHPVLLLSSDSGRARQLNTGARAAVGDVLLFLHADTHLPAAAKSLIEGALEDGTAVGGRFDVEFDIPSFWGYLIGTLMNLRSRLTGISTGDQALFVRKKVFHELGEYADIPLMEDIEFTARLKRRGPIIALRERVSTSFRRWRQHGTLNTILLMWILRLLYWVGISPRRLARLYTTVR